MENPQEQNLNKVESKQLRRQEKIEEKVYFTRRRLARKIIKMLSIFAAVGGGLGLIYWLVASQPTIAEDQIISRSGLHWHPELKIYIKGQFQEISGNIGLGAIHNPIHTHEADGVLHLEFSGLAKKDDLRLAKFFEVWKKQFNQNCIFDYCNGPEGAVKFLVNGKENSEFENYLMQDKDKIEIRYE